jgi:hypothetical protein
MAGLMATGARVGMRRSIPLFLFAALTVAFGFVSATASDRFTTDKPSPLKLAKPDKSEPQVTRFTGNVPISGRYVVSWDVLGNTPRYLRVTLQPNAESARLLPHPRGSEAVRELFFSNNDQAARLLLGPQAAARIFAKEVLSAEGEANVVISDYRSVIECDHYHYLAVLVSVSNSPDVAFAALPSKRSDC